MFFELLQVAVGQREALSHTPSENEWQELFVACQKQSLTAFVFSALDKLSLVGQKPPTRLLLEWMGLSEQVRSLNTLMNQEAARMTRLFEQEGHRTAILKGQANARLYPVPWGRQPGDIDIWVDGGRKKVLDTVGRLGLLEEEIVKTKLEGDTTISYHHLHLKKNDNGISVEVHFRPSSGNYNPITNRRLQTFLEAEISKENERVSEGFRVPSLTFALIMQLAHIQRHLIVEGVGLRQVIDYYYLLKNNEKIKKLKNESLSLRRLGLKHIAGGLMWVLHEVLGLEEQYLIAPMDEKRGKMLLQAIMEGGNFGYYRPARSKGLWQRIRSKHLHRLQMHRFDFWEAILSEFDFLVFFIKTIPLRIARRKWSLE